MTQSCYLAIETSTPLGSIAVGNGSSVLAEVVLGVQSRHSHALLPAIDFALAEAHVAKRDIARVIVGGGPGSFTGLRIAGATAKALTRASNIPLFAYSGLAALAAGAATQQPVCALFDARRGEVYAACYRFPDFARMETIMEPAPRHIEEVLNALDVAGTLFMGDGALQNRALISEANGMIAPAHLAVPRAASLLWLSDIMSHAGEVADIAAWEPLYLRDSGAERMRAR
jgi:tRNA threonylcarbamoyladenosine biosynthesis protein TsaB